MKNKFRLLAFSIFLFTGMAYAEIMQTQPLVSVLQSLKSNGYISVKKIELVQGEYHVNALNDQGDPVDIRINAHSGEIISSAKIDPHINMLEVVERIETMGFGGVYSVEATNNHYEVLCLDPNGKQARLKVDAVTGAITKEPL